MQIVGKLYISLKLLLLSFVISIIVSCSGKPDGSILWQKSQVLSNPFAADGVLGPHDSLEEAVDSILRSKNMSRLELREKEGSGAEGDNILAYSLAIDGYPLCKYEIKAAKVNGSAPLVIGGLPESADADVQIRSLDEDLINRMITDFGRGAYGVEPSIGTRYEINRNLEIIAMPTVSIFQVL